MIVLRCGNFSPTKMQFVCMSRTICEMPGLACFRWYALSVAQIISFHSYC